MQTDRSFERRFSLPGPVSLDARLDAGALRIKRGDDGVVSVHGVLRRRSSLFSWGDVESRMDDLARNPPVELSGGLLRLDSADGYLWNGISGLFEVTVPHQTRVRIHSDSADCRIEGIDGPLDCETDHGRLEASGIAAEVRVTTDHGDVEIRDVRGPVSVRSDSGQVEAAQIAGRIDIQADSARVTVSQTAAAPILVKTDSGDVTIRLCPASGYEITAETDHGSVSLPVLENQQVSGGRVRGRIRGGGPLVEVRTDGGDIEIE